MRKIYIEDLEKMIVIQNRIDYAENPFVSFLDTKTLEMVFVGINTDKNEIICQIGRLSSLFPEYKEDYVYPKQMGAITCTFAPNCECTDLQILKWVFKKYAASDVAINIDSINNVLGDKIQDKIKYNLCY